MSAKEHIITPPWSGYSSPVATQPSGNNNTPVIACSHCLEYCDLWSFFQTGSRIFLSCPLGPDEVGGGNFLKNLILYC